MGYCAHAYLCIYILEEEAGVDLRTDILEEEEQIYSRLEEYHLRTAARSERRQKRPPGQRTPRPAHTGVHGIGEGTGAS